jgi:hypothetical protein
VGTTIVRLDPVTGKLLSPRAAARAAEAAKSKFNPAILAELKEEARVAAMQQRQEATEQQRARERGGAHLPPGAKETHESVVPRLGQAGAVALLQDKLKYSSALRHYLQVEVRWREKGAGGSSCCAEKRNEGRGVGGGLLSIESGCRHEVLSVAFARLRAYVHACGCVCVCVCCVCRLFTDSTPS